MTCLTQLERVESSQPFDVSNLIRHDKSGEVRLLWLPVATFCFVSSWTLNSACCQSSNPS